MKHFDSSRPDFEPYGFTCELWEPVPMPRPDRHNEIEVNLLRSGTLTYLLGGRRAVIQPGRLVMFWAAIPHQIVASREVKPYYVITLPLAWFLAAGFPAEFRQHLLHGGLIADAAPLADDDPRFGGWVQDFEKAPPLLAKIIRMEIEARLLRMALAYPGASRRSQRTPEPNLNRADQLACYIAQHYAEPLTADQIAKAVGLHANYAMALFRKAFGITMTEFIVQHRITHAQRLLVTTDDSVINIAMASGFQSLSRFNAAFKKDQGCAPRDYRKAHEVQGIPPASL